MMVPPTGESITLHRDCQAIQVPYGTPMTLRAGTPLRITQQLGDTFTVQTDSGYLARIDGADADALGLTVEESTAPAGGPPSGPVTEEVIWEQLRTCYDPEIPCNIVELGLIYGCKIKAGEQGARVQIDMTLTAPGCGMGQVLHDDVQRKVSRIPGVEAVDVELAFDPPWHPGLMSEAARLQLGFM